MAVSKLNPVAAAASKTRYVETLLSGTSWTVPAGVTYVNAKLFGAGGGGGTRSSGPMSTAGGGQVVVTKVNTTPGNSISYAIGAGGAGVAATDSEGAAGGTTTFTGATSATGGFGGKSLYQYAAGPAGESAGNGGSGGYGNSGAGGAGKIELEYWLQEITMNKVFAVIENNTVTNIIVGVEDEVVAANPGKYIDYTDGWDYNNGIDGGVYFPAPEVTEPTE